MTDGAALAALKAKVDKYTPGFYRMLDVKTGDPSKDGAFPIARDEAARWNTPELGYGIFLTVNAFDGPRRKDRLARIFAWAIDIDAGTKQEQHDRLARSPLVPTMIVETKAGYHAWWAAKPGAKPEHWNAVVLERLVPHFGSDKNARDLCRILRAPGYLHLKDPSNPFPIRAVWRHDVSYSERQIADAFEWVPDRAAQRERHDEHRQAATTATTASSNAAPSESRWDAIYQLDCEDGLSRLSGHAAVQGERYTFKRAPRGRLNIFVNGKSSPCFIDEHKRIGSPSGGGPTLAQWLRWYGTEWSHVLDVLFEVFPKLKDIDDAAKAARRAA